MITITRGDDRNLNLYFLRANKRPFDLTGWTQISVFFKKQDGGLLEKNTIPYTITAFVEYEGVTFTAVTPGAGGNTILLAFDGIKTITQVITAWNTVHPLNQVTSDATTPNTTILPSGSAELENGETNALDVRVISELLGHITVNIRDTDTVQFMLGKSLTFKATIDKDHPPAGERRNIMFYNQLEVVDDRF